MAIATYHTCRAACIGSRACHDTHASSTALAPPAGQHQRTRIAARITYTKPSATAHASTVPVVAHAARIAAGRSSLTGRRERSEHLHDEHALAVALEARAELALEHAHDIGILAEHLRAHAARRDLQPRIGVD